MRALMSLKICLQGCQYLTHGQGPTIKDAILDGCQRIGHGAQANALDVGCVVSRTAIVVVLAVGDAVINQEGQKGGRHVGCVQPLDEVIAPYLDVHKVPQLLLKGDE